MDNHSSKCLSIQQEEDRISNLPEAIVHHIFHFLPTVDAARTTLLSSRWNRFWASLATLDFDEYRDEFNHHQPVTFEKFVNKALFFRDSINIHTFRLCSGAQTTTPPDINNWLSVAAWRNVVVLEVFVDDDLSVAFPSSLFCCNSLQHLKLGFVKNSELVIPDSVCFPSLKYLFLRVIPEEHFEFNFIARLVSSCPVLQEFEVEIQLDYQPKLDLKISSSTLNRLAIDIFFNNMPDDNFNDSSFFISAPKLIHMTVCSAIPARYSILCPLSIDKVSLNLGFRAELYDDLGVDHVSLTNLINSDLHPVCAFQLLSVISKVRDLTLRVNTTRVLISACKNDFPTFGNLIHLEISLPNGCGLQLLSYFLRNSANLKKLVVRKEYIKKADLVKEFQLMPCDTWSDYPVLNLEVVEMKELNGEHHELEVIKYLLRNAHALKSFSIWSKTLVAKDIFCKQVPSFAISSAACSIEFH